MRCPLGFTVAAGFTASGGDLARLRADIDAVVALGGTTIRIGADLYHTEPGHLAHLRSGIEYARAQGCTVMLTTSQIAHNGEATAAATATAVGFVRTVATAVGDLVTWWQIANEHDARDWRDWSRALWDTTAPDQGEAQRQRALMDVPYLETLRDVIAACAAEVRAVNPDVVILTATTGVGANTDVELVWRRFYDVVGPAVDMLGINLYPIVWWEKYLEMPARLRRTARRYGKQILITEIGLPKGTVDDELETGAWIAHQIDRASRSLDVGGVWVYELRDGGTDPANAEDNFGILTNDGTRKPYAVTVQTMLRSINT